MSTRSEEKGEKSCEIRLGIVMYGGVSLAIYINGVAYEFFRAVRGQGIYKLVKALTDADIIVDIISGTSAGGINGILLAYALCNTRDFSVCAQLWRENADVRALLRSPYEGSKPEDSLFQSEEYFQPQLEKAFATMPPYEPEDNEDNSQFNELDLFVTSTDVDGKQFSQIDAAGHVIDVKDHRAVFVLKHRKDRKEPFKPDRSENGKPEATYQALAKLARLTACFPFAFKPVHVQKEAADEETVDGKLQTWGKLGKEAHFLDGGGLDNKPFTSTLREIFYRTADRKVIRKLFYVEPDPEHFDPQTGTPSPVTNNKTPNVLQAVLAALIGIPGYESISDDLRLLADHNSKLERYNRFAASLTESAETSDLSPEQLALYGKARLIALSERAIRGVLRVEGQDQYLQAQDEREAASRLYRGFD